MRRPSLPLLVLLLAGCLGAPAEPLAAPVEEDAPATREPETREPEDAPPPPAAPERGPRAKPLDVRTFHVTWSGEGVPRTHEMAWDVAEAWTEDGLGVLDITTQSHEGGDFHMRLWWRAASPSMLAHEESAASPQTFDFTYREEVYWSARPVTHVERVHPESYVRLDDYLTELGRAKGTFLLDFVGACPGCGDYDRPRPTRIEGSFGP